MPRMILSIALIAILGFAATETIPSATATTQPVCQADQTNPDHYEVVTGKSARPGTCVVTLTVDETFSIVIVQTKMTRDWLTATDDLRIWMNFDSWKSAQRFACTLVKSARQTHPGYFISTDLKCFTAFVIGVFRN